MYVNVVTFDNTDPAVYGPYESEEAAVRGQGAIVKKLGEDRHITGLTAEVVMKPVEG